MKNTSKTLKIVSILTVVFYSLVILIPLSIKGILAVLGYSTGIIRLSSILMMICAAILAAAVFVDKEPVRTIICVATCAVGATGIAVFGNRVTLMVYDFFVQHVQSFLSRPDLRPFEVILSGYPLLALMALAAYLGHKKGKGFRAVCYVIALFLLAGVVGNIYKMTCGEIYYDYNGIYWDRVYFDIALLINSIACVLWGWRRILQNKTRTNHKEEGGVTP